MTFIIVIQSLTFAIVIGYWIKFRQDQVRLAVLQRRVALRETEILRLAASQEKLAEIQQLTESVIDGGTAATRRVHQEIANIPFDVLESIPATRDTAKLVRGVHDLTSDGVYGTISLVNKLFGEGSRAGIRRGDKPKDE